MQCYAFSTVDSYLYLGFDPLDPSGLRLADQQFAPSEWSDQDHHISDPLLAHGLNSLVAS